MPDKTLIQSVKILGTVDNVRALLHKYSNWWSSAGKSLLLDELHRKLPVQAKRSFIIDIDIDYVNPPTCGTWRVGIWQKDNSSTKLVAAGIIEAYEILPGQTTIEFWDGIDENIKPIGTAFVEYCRAILDEFQAVTNAKNAQETKEKSWQQPPEEPDMVGKPGNPGLPHQELIGRLALAQKGEEIRKQYPRKGWKQIANELRWKYGNDAKGIKLLEEARKKLKRANEDTLQEIREWRKKKEKN